MSQNKWRIITIIIIAVFIIGLVGLSIRMAVNPTSEQEERTEFTSVLQSGLIWIN